jgi:hypothetical protein
MSSPPALDCRIGCNDWLISQNSRRSTVMFGFGSAFIGYLAAAGLATNAAVVGHGLVGSARLAAQGRLASPAVMATASARDLFGGLNDGASELSGQALRATRPTSHGDRAA